MGFYDNSAATAKRLLTKYGQPCPIRRLSKTYDPIAGASTENIKETGTLLSVVLPIGNAARSLIADADNKTIEDLISGKMRYIISAALGSPYEPEANDVITVAGADYVIRGVSPLNPAGTALIYKMLGTLAPGLPDDSNATDLGDTERAAADLTQVVQVEMPDNL